MSDLIVDRQQEMGETPGLHALIVGIGAYPFLPKPGQPGRAEQFGLTQVDGPAVGAFRLARLLQNPMPGSRLVRPLKTLRLMLAPTAADMVVEPDLAGWAGTLPTRKAVKTAALDWRRSCEASDDEVALFAFFGHGLYCTQDHLVLADHGEDAAAGNVSLDACAPLDPLMQGLAAPDPLSGTTIARKQFWFIDACRSYVGDDRPGAVGTAATLIDTRREDSDKLVAGGLSSTAPGAAAFAADASGNTPFGAALLAALAGAVGESVTWPPEGDAATDVWPVTVNTIRQAIDRNFERRSPPLAQKPRGLGADGRWPLLLFDTRPACELWFRVRPPREPTVIASFRLQDADAPVETWQAFRAIDPHPLRVPFLAGHCKAEYVSEGKPIRKFWFASLAADEQVL